MNKIEVKNGCYRKRGDPQQEPFNVVTTGQVMTTCSFVSRYRPIGGIYRLHIAKDWMADIRFCFHAKVHIMSELELFNELTEYYKESVLV